jgi:hypothetical protein
VAPADKLGDPFEGSYPKINIQKRAQFPESVTRANQSDKPIEIKATSFDCPRLAEVAKHIFMHIGEYNGR